MRLYDRIKYLQDICTRLSYTSSLNEKKDIIDNIDNAVRDDFNFILEILDGQHPLGYTYIADYLVEHIKDADLDCTFKEYIDPLWEPSRHNDFTLSYIRYICNGVQLGGDFIARVVNRKLRLGIGKSLLDKRPTSPMLAKKFDEKTYKKLSNDAVYYVTEKLDGNRCIAMFVNGKWTFTSRNGKPMSVSFDMTGLPAKYVYDGEVLSKAQTKQSILITSIIRGDNVDAQANQQSFAMFSSTSGAINSKAISTDLVYNIFDIVTDVTYFERRQMLQELKVNSSNVRILPVLQCCTKSTLDHEVTHMLDDVTRLGGEGLMINIGTALYQQKRTDALLKVKGTQTMDMKVVDIEQGSGKYLFMTGALVCECTLDNGDKIVTKVGTGLSDEQRYRWAYHPEEILGKIVEVAYFSLSQNSSTQGTKIYSMRFPRLKAVRDDKTITSSF